MEPVGMKLHPSSMGVANLQTIETEAASLFPLGKVYAVVLSKSLILGRTRRTQRTCSFGSADLVLTSTTKAVVPAALSSLSKKGREVRTPDLSSHDK